MYLWLQKINQKKVRLGRQTCRLENVICCLGSTVLKLSVRLFK